MNRLDIVLPNGEQWSILSSKLSLLEYIEKYYENVYANSKLVWPNSDIKDDLANIANGNKGKISHELEELCGIKFPLYEYTQPMFCAPDNEIRFALPNGKEWVWHTIKREIKEYMEKYINLNYFRNSVKYSVYSDETKDFISEEIISDLDFVAGGGRGKFTENMENHGIEFPTIIGYRSSGESEVNKLFETLKKKGYILQPKTYPLKKHEDILTIKTDKEVKIKTVEL